MTRAVYAGTFDPVHYGHIDIISRASGIFDELIIGVGVNPDKSPIFSAKERIEMLEEALVDMNNLKIVRFKGLLVDFAKEQGAKVVVRGVRTTSDMESEFQMALTNKQLNYNIETFFMPSDECYTTYSSTLVKQIVKFGKDDVEEQLEKFIPENVIRRLLGQ